MSNAQSPDRHGSTTERPTSGRILAVFAEPLVRGRRVAVVGVADERLTDLLLSFGARLVYVYDPSLPTGRVHDAAPRVDRPDRSDPAGRTGEGTTERPPGAIQRVSIASFRTGELGVRDGAFDVALAPDLALLGDPEAALTQIRRLVGPNGVAVIGSRNPAAAPTWLAATAPESRAPSYNDFYDLCALQFAEVRMIGVAPFAAYAVAEFAPDGEPQVAFDTTLVDAAEPPDWYLAVAAQRPGASCEPYQVVQFPRTWVSREREAQTPVEDGELASTRHQLAAVEHKLKEAEARAGDQYIRGERLGHDVRALSDEIRKKGEVVARLGKELEEERRARARELKELEEERRARAKLTADLAAPRRSPELTGLRERVAALEAELIEARTQLATPRVSPGDVARLQHERETLAIELASTRDSVSLLAVELAATRDRAVGLERAVLEADQRIGELETGADQLRHRLLERERALEASLQRAKGLEDRLAEELAESSLRIEADQRAIEQLREHLGATEARVAASQVEASQLHGIREQLRASEARLAAGQDELAQLQGLRDHLRLSESRGAAAQTELAQLQALHQEEVEALEAGLRSLGEELRAARAELARRERIVRELVADVEELQDDAAARMAADARPPAVTPQPSVPRADEELSQQLARARQEAVLLAGELTGRDHELVELRAVAERCSHELEEERARIERLIRDAARREAELQTSAWRIAELEKLGSERSPPDPTSRPSPPSPGEDPRIASEAARQERQKLEVELDALRRALAQEHERCERLERQARPEVMGLGDASTESDPLARALARLAEREALIAQLSAELAARQGT